MVGWRFGGVALWVCQYLKINQLSSSLKYGLLYLDLVAIVHQESIRVIVQILTHAFYAFPIESLRIHIRTVVIFTKTLLTTNPLILLLFTLFPDQISIVAAVGSAKQENQIQQKQMISLGSGFDFSCNWQLAYEQLLVLYSQMNADYQRAQETGVILTEKIETITKENEEIRSKKMIKTFQTIPNQIVPSFTQISHLEPEITIKVPKKSPQLPKTSERIRRLNSIQTSEGNFYECSYQGCGRVYQSSVSLNLHIKIKHNGGTKKEREEYAKMVIDAEERGDKAPHVPIEFPPNFLQEFRTTYSYMKKYSM